MVSQTCPFTFVELCDVDGFEVRSWREGSGESAIRFDPAVHPSLPNVQKFKPPEVAVSHEKFLALWLDSYRLLKPKKHVLAEVEKLGVDSDCVGFHVRMTDKVCNDRTPALTVVPEQVQKLESTALSVLQKQLKKLNLGSVFLAADNEESKQQWQKRLSDLGYRVISHSAKFDSSLLRQTSGEDFAVDLFSLARCKTIVGTTYSGVVRSAAWISGHRDFTFAAQQMLSVRIWTHLMVRWFGLKRALGL